MIDNSIESSMKSSSDLRELVAAHYTPDKRKQEKFSSDFGRVFDRVEKLFETNEKLAAEKGFTINSNVPADLISVILLLGETVEQHRLGRSHDDIMSTLENSKVGYPSVGFATALLLEKKGDILQSGSTIKTSQLELGGYEVAVTKMDITPLFRVKAAPPIKEKIVSLENLGAVQESIPSLAAYIAETDSDTTKFVVAREGLVEKMADNFAMGQTTKSLARGMDKAVNFATRWLTDLPRKMLWKSLVAGSPGERYTLYSWPTKDRKI